MKSIYLTEEEIKKVENLAGFLKISLRQHYTIVQIAEKLSMPEKKLKRAFKKMHGKGIYTYLKDLRLEKSRQLLIEGMSLQVVIAEIGYKNKSHFSTAFTKQYGESPGSFRKRHYPRAS